MRRSIRLAIGALALGVPASTVEASGDYGCTVRWKLPSRAYDCANRATLSPGNDTRVNLLYLLRDTPALAPSVSTRPKPGYDDLLYGNTFFDWRRLRATFYPNGATAEAEAGRGDYYGSRCVSLATGATAFIAALTANAKVPAAERAALTSSRGILVRRCEGHRDEAPAWPAAIKSAPGREFLGYLQAAAAFYGEEWSIARQGFAGLRTARDPWVSEAATYMLPRTELNAAQAAAFDEYGSFAGSDTIDRGALIRAQTGFADYRQRFARGRYVASAEGLGRRALWLNGDVQGLSRTYERLLGHTPPTREAAADLVEEIDNKLLIVPGSRAAIDGPLLLATVDLMRMRPSDDGGEVLSGQDLAAQNPRFVGHEDLYGLILASHAYYVAGDPRAVLQIIPDGARQPQFSTLQFSRQVVRGLALAALKDRNEAGFWRDMLGGADAVYQRPLVELGLAMNWERNGKLADVFAAGSPIAQTAIREILLIQVAGPGLLRTQAQAAGRPRHERDVALFTLLQKQLIYGDYAGFLGDLALVAGATKGDDSLWNIRQQEIVPLGLFRAGRTSDGFACPALRATAQALARNPRDARARLCLGDFYRLNGFDDYMTYPEAPKTDELGGTPTQFRGRAAPRSVIYADVIADPAVAPSDKAYALYRAVNCYAPTGSNQCGGIAVAQGQRQAWFQRLKRDHADSEWAKTLRYYW